MVGAASRARLAALTVGMGVIGVIAPSPIRGETPRCEAVAEVEPDRAYVGQQVAYRLRILRRKTTGTVRWRENLTFPGFRVEWLPGSIQKPIRDAAGDANVFDERRALFPARAGTLRIPEAGLLCNGPEGDLLARIGATELLSMPVPTTGRPADWTGVVGPVEVRTNLDSESTRLGEGVRLSILIHGSANVWDARVDPTEALAAQGAEVFARPVEIARDVGRRLTLRRYAVFDIVPREIGTLEVPEIRVPWFDPESATYQLARARRRVISVEPRAQEGVGGAGRDRLSGAAADPSAGPLGVDPDAMARARGPLLALLTAAVLTGSILLWRRRTGGQAADPELDIQGLLARAVASERAGDLEQALATLSRCARLALSDRLPGALSLSTEELFERAIHPGEREFVLLLQRLDRARFGREASAAEVRDVRASLEVALARGAGLGTGG